jgi:hypothetical protein
VKKNPASSAFHGSSGIDWPGNMICPAAPAYFGKTEASGFTFPWPFWLNHFNMEG